MDRFLIKGGVPLRGKVDISGAKNAALPQMAAALLSDKPVVLRNVPDLQDIQSMILLLVHLGARVRREGSLIEIDASQLHNLEAPYDIVRKMRASIVVLGPLLARNRRARVSLPGGCAIGARPVDLHIEAMRHLGAQVQLDRGYIDADASSGFNGGEIVFEKVTVTGTENAMMAAVLADGTSTLRNCAMEPEVVDLGLMLINMGANINGLGTPTLVINGVDRLAGTEHEIIPDRIEAGTYLVAGLITRGEVAIENCRPDDLAAVTEKVQECGARLEVERDRIVTMPSELKAADVRTAPFPGFATDMQAQYVALMTQAEGRSVVKETIFENRFMHAPELIRMGADIRIESNTAIVRGGLPLSGASVMATDLRASASLVLAALVAEGESTINRVYHIDRGYSHIVRRLKNLGAKIERIA